MIDKVGAVPGIFNQISVDASNKVVESGSFQDVLQREIKEVDAGLMHSEKTINDFAVGKEQSLPSVMLAMEKSKLSFEMMVQIRNRLMEGYNEIIKMQV